ncbi:hydantoinase/oxoprolinase family protein [Phenylobacterium sp. LjRoot225]|uniref:hydantoinase/oxoprolinase family protein n=1 Tax=Phenylobacterium sp. LjRoot225 TaxID=3342285 RepID=UPI003ECD6681
MARSDVNGGRRARIGSDIGGTFTDIVLEDGERRFSTKRLTTYDAPERALLEGVAELLAQAGLSPADVGLMVHGTTLATNALIARRGAVTGLLTTEGFRDVLEMGSESRFDQYDLSIAKPAPLVPRKLRLTAAERVAADGEVLLALDVAAVERAAEAFEAAGVESVAIGFLHSYANPAHERAAAAILAERLPQASLSLSSEVSPEIREYERFSTTAANAYVRPLMDAYLRQLERKLAQAGFDCPLFLMLSSGGLTSLDTAARFPVRLVESGPAGGAIFAASIAAERGVERMLALDVGGTTAKICFIDDGRPQMSQGFEVARVHRFRKGSGLPLRIPVVEMVEIGAGGGSIAHLDRVGRLNVGPQSAASEPGPACYGRGGTEPTVTDADLMMGRVDPEAFAAGTIRLDPTAAETALRRLDPAGDARLLAFGVGEIVDEVMASATRAHAVEQGAAVEDRTMVAFGGAAPLHAGRIAEKLGVSRVIVPSGAGVGSAVGFLRAPIGYEISRSRRERLGQVDLDGVNAVLAEMSETAHGLVRQGAPSAERVERRTAYARYVGQGYEISVEIPARRLGDGDEAVLLEIFETAYRRQYGRTIPQLPIEILTWRVNVSAGGWRPQLREPVGRLREVTPGAWREVFDPASGAVRSYGVVRRETLSPGDWLRGPLLVVEDQTTTVAPAAFDLCVDAYGYLVLDRRPVQGAPS